MNDLKNKIKKISDSEFIIEKEGDMNVPVKIFSSDKLLESLSKDKSLTQCVNVAKLPGIYSAAMVMPDGHQGYGFPIGGVAAFDTTKGIITPGGIGFDINCGVRLLVTPLKKSDIEPKIHELLESLFKNVPSGVGSENKIKLSDEELDEILNTGCNWALRKGYAFPEDLEVTESNGCMSSADASCVSPRAKARGRKQSGSLGSGNHFLEIQVVDEIFDEKIAKVFGLEKNQIVIMIHTGSRGLGHQVCSDYIRLMEEDNIEIANSLPDRDLIYAKANSPMANQYFKAMSATANFAWCNRQVIAHFVRESFSEIFNIDPKSIKQVYDVAHNIAKKEIHSINGKSVEVYVHRKGATRAFPANHPDIPLKYQEVGQPVLLPGSMGTASYVLVGTETAMEKSFGSTAHGAGRVMSRHEAIKSFNGDQITKELEDKKIYVLAASKKGICEEAPQVYKDVDEVVKVSENAGLTKTVAKVLPFGVIKG